MCSTLVNALLLIVSNLLYIVFCAKSSPSVAIVGAGPAGIAAAVRLFRYGIENLVILEAENRIGGRINTVPIGDGIVDMGAEFCHGEVGNLVYNVVKDLDLLEDYYTHTLPRFFDSYGTKLPLNISKDLLYFASEFPTKAGESIGSVYENTLKKSELFKKYGHEPRYSQIFTDLYRWFDSWVCGFEGSFSMYNSSSISHYEDCPGSLSLTWKKDGYLGFIKIFAERHSVDFMKFVKFKNRVTRISYNHDKVILNTLNGNKYMVDHVIFTPSVGVLKSNHHEIFSPYLPATKVEAIEKIGFDGVMKVVLLFKRRWWPDEVNGFNFFWDEKSIERLRIKFPDAPSWNGSPWISEVKIVAAPSNNKKILIFWIAGEVLKQVERLPIRKLRNGVLYAMKKFLSRNYKVEHPRKIIRSIWANNPNFRGTYSYERAEHFRNDVNYQKILAEPLYNCKGAPKVLFAGEATNAIHYGTVHGAMETGYREANRIVQYNLKEL